MPRLKIKPRRFSVSSPRWPRIKVPSFSLVSAIRVPGMVNLGRFIPRLAIRVGGTKALLAVLLVVVTGFGATIFMVVERTTEHTPIWPEAGAEYALPSTIGKPLPPDPATPTEVSQTLQITLSATGARVDQLIVRNVSVGKTGTDCFATERTSGTGYLYIDEMEFINVSAPTLDWGNSEVGTLTLAGSVDGHTQAGTLDATIPEITVTSSRGAGSYVADGGSVDRVLITGTGNADIGSLVLENFHCGNGAGIDLDYLKVGTFTQDAATRVGDATGIDSASYIINSTVRYRSATDSLIDTPISVR